MAFNFYLMGHGVYRERNGTFALPKGWAVNFYSPHGTSLPEADISGVLRNTLGPVRSYVGGQDVPNYTWQNGEPDNWNLYVCGTGPDLRKRANLSSAPGPNAHLHLHERDKSWDVRYVQFFKRLANMPEMGEYTLKMLVDGDWLRQKAPGGEVVIHSVLCSVIEGPRPRFMLRFRDSYNPGGTKQAFEARSRVTYNLKAGETIKGEAEIDGLRLEQTDVRFSGLGRDWIRLRPNTAIAPAVGGGRFTISAEALPDRV